MISIVGGSGFIGTRLCRRFAGNSVPFVIVDKAVSATFPEKTVIADVRESAALEQSIEGNVIINLAAEHRDDVTPRSLYDQVNVGGAENLCAEAERKGIEKIIFTSSVAVYGFAPEETDERGEINYFNDYGRTKYEAEQIFKAWQAKAPERRSLVIVRPTVVFGERNRGNVYNLLRQIASGRFLMIGDGHNVKSMAYVENVAAFLEHALSFGPGTHLYNYIDKPDFDMNKLVKKVYTALGKKEKINFRIPYSVGYALGRVFDLVAMLTGKKFPISSIRVKKFCANSSFETSVAATGFVPPVSLEEGLLRTIRYEFVEEHKEDQLFYSE